jgi:hypothetical protein
MVARIGHGDDQGPVEQRHRKGDLAPNDVLGHERKGVGVGLLLGEV